MILVADIKAAVAKKYRIPVEDLSGRCRTQEIVKARQVAMTLSRQLCVSLGWTEPRPISFSAIGRRFGNRDHSTVMSALKAAEKRRLDDPELDRAMKRLAKRLCDEPAKRSTQSPTQKVADTPKARFKRLTLMPRAY